MRANTTPKKMRAMNVWMDALQHILLQLGREEAGCEAGKESEWKGLRTAAAEAGEGFRAILT
jgi:hypothetical protein